MTPYFQDGGIQIFHGDCREILPTLPKVDLVLTDPPYGIGADKRNAHSSIRDSSKWADPNWDERRPSQETFELLLTAAASVAIWGGNYFADLLPPSPCWLAWIKPEAETGFSLADVEYCWTSRSGSSRVKHLPRRDGNLHPTQKPLRLMLWCLQQFPNVGTVLDPYMGSGTTLLAAKKMGLRAATGIDREERYCEIAAKRLSQSVLDFGGSKSDEWMAKLGAQDILKENVLELLDTNPAGLADL